MLLLEMLLPLFILVPKCIRTHSLELILIQLLAIRRDFWKQLRDVVQSGKQSMADLKGDPSTSNGLKNLTKFLWFPYGSYIRKWNSLEISKWLTMCYTSSIQVYTVVLLLYIFNIRTQKLKLHYISIKCHILKFSTMVYGRTYVTNVLLKDWPPVCFDILVQYE